MGLIYRVLCGMEGWGGVVDVGTNGCAGCQKGAVGSREMGFGVMRVFQGCCHTDAIVSAAAAAAAAESTGRIRKHLDIGMRKGGIRMVLY